MSHGNGNDNSNPTTTTTQLPGPVSTQRGFIRSIQASRGFGFLVGIDNVERFFHVSELKGAKLEELKVGRPVLFTPEPDRGKGPRACCVLAG